MRDSEQGMDRVRRLYTPDPLGPERRAALRAAVDVRVRSGPRYWFVAAAFGVAIVLALVAQLMRPVPAPEVSRVAHSNDRWVEDVLFGAEQEDVSVPLPGEYAALAELLGR